MTTCYPKDGSIIKQAKCMTIIRNTGVYDKRFDEYRDYLRYEIKPEVWEELERARWRWGAINIRPESIDQIIEYQNESKLKAIRFIKYKYLGECTYIEVYGDSAKKEYEESRASMKIAEMDKKIDLIIKALGLTVSDEKNIVQLKRA